MEGVLRSYNFELNAFTVEVLEILEKMISLGFYISEEELLKILGPGHSKDKYQGNEVAGVVTGLAWTSVGGDILFIESSLSKGKGKITLSGQLLASLLKTLDPI